VGFGGVPVYVIVNVPDQLIECHEEPLVPESRYGRRTDFQRGETLMLPLGEGHPLTLAVDDVFGPTHP
jgi:hypothetical protein